MLYIWHSAAAAVPLSSQQSRQVSAGIGMLCVCFVAAGVVMLQAGRQCASRVAVFVDGAVSASVAAAFPHIYLLRTLTACISMLC